MTPEAIRTVCQGRLGKWTEHMVESNATPVVLVGVKIGDAGGGLVVSTVDDMTDHQLLTLVTGLERALSARVASQRFDYNAAMAARKVG